MRFNVLGYFISEGIRNVFKNKKSTFSCLGVMCATMLLFGLFFAIGENINSMIKEIENSQGMQIFMYTDSTDKEIEALGEQLNQIEGVNTVSFETKEQAYNNMKKRLADRDYLMEGLEPDIFSVSYIITLTDLSLNSQVLEQVKQLENVKKVQNKEDTIQKLSSIGNWVKIVTLVILIILILISVFIISNTIKLTVHARRKEISIMKYVGATNGFIRSPFIVEGILLGLISGIISILIVGGGYNYIESKLVQSTVWQGLGVNLLGFNQMATQIVMVYMILGVGIGVIGSSISMKKYLDV